MSKRNQTDTIKKWEQAEKTGTTPQLLMEIEESKIEVAKRNAYNRLKRTGKPTKILVRRWNTNAYRQAKNNNWPILENCTLLFYYQCTTSISYNAKNHSFSWDGGSKKLFTFQGWDIIESLRIRGNDLEPHRNCLLNIAKNSNGKYQVGIGLTPPKERLYTNKQRGISHYNWVEPEEYLLLLTQTRKEK